MAFFNLEEVKRCAIRATVIRVAAAIDGADVKAIR